MLMVNNINKLVVITYDNGMVVVVCEMDTVVTTDELLEFVIVTAVVTVV